MSAARIELSFSQALRQAKLIDDVADQMSRLATNSIENTMQNISINWKGDSSSAFLGKTEILQKDVAETAERLYAIAQSIRMAAQRIYDAEMQALRIAEERKQI